jgi:hypothetical protein
MNETNYLITNRLKIPIIPNYKKINANAISLDQNHFFCTNIVSGFQLVEIYTAW